MTFLRSGMVLCLFALFCVTVVSAAGNGTFSITSSKGVDTGDTVTATVFLENNWDPKASDVYMHVLFNSSMLEYVSTDYKIGHTVAATKDTENSIFLQFGDFTNGYPNGEFPIADLKFRALRAGISPLTVVVDHVRYYAPVDIGDSASVESGTVTIGSGVPSTGVPEGSPTVTPGETTQSTSTPTITPTITPTSTPPTITPITTVSTVTPTITPPTVTSTITVPTIIPTQTMIVVTLSISPADYASSDDYTGVVTGQPTTTSTTSATSSPVNTTAPPTTGVAGQTQTPSMTVSPAGTNQTTPISTLTSAVTTTIRSLVPVNATTTKAAGTDIGLLLLSLGGIGILFIARRVR